jgi:YD repeat-containing protein
MAPSFRLVLWANPAVASASLSISLDNASNWSQTLPVTEAGQWRQYEVLVPIGHSAGTAAPKLRIQLAAGSGAVHLDDVLLLPTGAAARSITYNPLVGKTAEIASNGRTSYYDYDQAGQLRQVRDHNGHITSRTEQAPGGMLASETPVLALVCTTAQQESGVELPFTITGLCGASFSTVNWTFTVNANVMTVNTIGLSTTHIFPASTSYTPVTVSVQVNTPQGPVTASLALTLAPPPYGSLVVTLCKAGLLRRDECGVNADTWGNECTNATANSGLLRNQTRYEASVPAQFQTLVGRYEWYRVHVATNVATLVSSGPATPNYWVAAIDQDQGYAYNCKVILTDNVTRATSANAAVNFYKSTGTSPCGAPHGQ